MAGLEFAILDFIQNHFRSEFGDSVMVLISALGDKGLIWIAFGLALIAGRKHWKAGVMVLCALALDSLICNVILKPLIARIRPCDVYRAVELLIPAPKDYSFPSGHTAAAFATVTALYMAKVKYWLPALILAVLMAFSRMYLYVHYPTDILGGIACGVFSGVVTGMVILRSKSRLFRG